MIDERNMLDKIAGLEELARKRVLDKPTNSPCYMRYVTQLNERTAFKHMIADAPKIEEWILCNERLPEDPEVMVLVQVSGRPRSNIELVDALEMGVYDPEEGWILEMYPEYEDAHPVAWMPLPEPYKEKDRG